MAKNVFRRFNVERVKDLILCSFLRMITQLFLLTNSFIGNYDSYIVTETRIDRLSAGQSDQPIFIRFSVANASKTKDLILG